MTTVHRLLDEAFAGIPLTPEVADLKEEIRAGLLDRAAELEAGGVGSEEAARRAVAELGDVHALVDEVADGGAPAPSASTASRSTRVDWSAAHELHTLHKVRPRPGFVVAVVLASLVAAGGIVAYALVAALGDGAVLVPVLLAVVVGLAIGWTLGSSLAQETTSNHPVPRRRAVAWGAACALTVGGAGVLLAGLPLWADQTPAVWVTGGLLTVLGVALFTWVGVTQTNRRKAWARELGEAAARDDRFSRDPAAAARFGMYTAVIWVSAAVVAGVVGMAWSWRWSWLPFVAGWIAMMLLLATMLFGKEKQD